MQQKIVPIGKDMEFLDAFNAVKDRGGLPSNVLHDDTLMNASLLETIKQACNGYYGAWCRELIAYPAKYDVFAKGDIKDSDYNLDRDVFKGSTDTPRGATL